MPEVVYPSPDDNGVGRTWEQVFPIIKGENADKAAADQINDILYGIALNSRFGGKTPAELKLSMRESLDNWFGPLLERIDSGEENLPTRETLFARYGREVWYLDKVFENLGGAYRASK
jgi:hypothetical protein